VSVAKKQSYCLPVILPGSHVQRRKLQFGTGFSLEKHNRHLGVTLLYSNRQRREVTLQVVGRASEKFFAKLFNSYD
jgi:hypothetical protein